MSALSNLSEILGRERLIPVVRTETAEGALWASRQLVESGFGILEITDTVPGAEVVIKTLCSEFPEICIGAGTVLSSDAAHRLMGAGAQFLVSPVWDEGVFDAARSQGVPLMPGAMTPTEIHHAWQRGARMIKVFPAPSLGGASYIRSLKDVFPHIHLIPTGGITPENVAYHLQAGALAVGLGQNLLPADAVMFQDAQRISELARQYRHAATAALSPLETATRII